MTPAEKALPETCLWTEDDDGVWSTGCKVSEWCFSEQDRGTPKNNNMRFCPFCGKPLRQRSCRER
jgi:hypothetical protein